MLLRKLKQPYLIAYIIAGIILGPDVPGIVHDKHTISELGELGLIFLMFFIGAEINLPDLTKNIKKPLIGTITQLLLIFMCISTVGFFLDWSINMVILLSFVISLSSSAIIFQYLYINKKNQLKYWVINNRCSAIVGYFGCANAYYYQLYGTGRTKSYPVNWCKCWWNFDNNFS